MRSNPTPETREKAHALNSAALQVRAQQGTVMCAVWAWACCSSPRPLELLSLYECLVGMGQRYCFPL
jgi:hypothetical protein